MKIVLVAHDVAPSKAFERLSSTLFDGGHNVECFLGMGKGTDTTSFVDMRLAIRDASIVVIGMSSSKELARPEIVACALASKFNIPFGFYGDTYRCHERAADDKWFAPYRNEAQFFFALNNEEAKDAKRVFPNARCVVTGNPVWEGFAFPKYTRAKIRKQLKVDHDTKVILSPGGKCPAVNILMWGMVIEACDAANNRHRNFQIICAPHPGDKVIQPPADEIGLYDDLSKWSPVPLSIPGINTKTSDVLPGCDLLVEHGSTLGIEAAFQRKPIMSIASKIARARMAETTGSEEWILCELGVSKETDFSLGANHIARVIDNMLNPDWFSAYRVRQEEVYPTSPERGAAAKKMANALSEIV